MGIDPDYREILAIHVQCAGHCAQRNDMVSANNEGEIFGFQRVDHSCF